MTGKGLCDDALRKRMASVKHIVLVLSGKGGVGKSTVATQLALGLMHAGNKVGVLDIDLCGPSVPRMLGAEDLEIYSCPDGWVPVYKHDQRLAIMSIGFLLGDKSEAVVWRGPKKTAMIKQFLADVCWGDLDYLVIDTPPGTSDEHLAVVECVRHLQPDGAVLVTTPQGLALSDVMREATFCKKAKLPILGLVENMSGFVCPHCSECTHLFSTGGGERLAQAIPCPFLGRLPIDPEFGREVGEGRDYMGEHEGSQTHTAVMAVVNKLTANTERAESGQPSKQPHQHKRSKDEGEGTK